MTIPPGLEAQVLRYYHVEKWRTGTIAAQLGVHHGTATRVLTQAGLPQPGAPRRASAIGAYLPFIRETLEKFPAPTASRLYAMVKGRGCPGSPGHFRHLIALHRPRPKAEAYLRLRTLPGGQAQVDWGHFGHLEAARARRALMGFVRVLSWPRQIFLRFFLGAHMENFLRGHVGAFAAWGGVPKTLPYDNLKSAVLERQGQAIRFNPVLLGFAAPPRYEPRPVAVAGGNEKGRVGRAIRHIRDNFFAGRTFTGLNGPNTQAEAWMTGPAADRSGPLGRITVALLDLPDRYGAAELQAGIKEALQRGVPHPNAVRLALERRRGARELPPPVEMALPSHVQGRDTPAQAHKLDSYGQVTEVGHGPG